MNRGSGSLIMGKILDLYKIVFLDDEIHIKSTFLAFYTRNWFLKLRCVFCKLFNSLKNFDFKINFSN